MFRVKLVLVFSTCGAETPLAAMNLRAHHWLASSATAIPGDRLWDGGKISTVEVGAEKCHDCHFFHSLLVTLYAFILYPGPIYKTYLRFFIKISHKVFLLIKHLQDAFGAFSIPTSILDPGCSRSPVQQSQASCLPIDDMGCCVGSVSGWTSSIGKHGSTGSGKAATKAQRGDNDCDWRRFWDHERKLDAMTTIYDYYLWLLDVQDFL